MSAWHHDKGNGRWTVWGRDGRNYLWYRIVMWNELGRELRSDEQVHHINGDPGDDRLENLRVVSAAEHFAIHREQGDLDGIFDGLRKAARITNAERRQRRVMLVCDQCSEPFERVPSHVSENNFCSQPCKVAFQTGRHSKLSAQQIREILASDKSDRALAREYGVCNHTIAACKRAA